MINRDVVSSYLCMSVAEFHYRVNQIKNKHGYGIVAPCNQTGNDVCTKILLPDYPIAELL